MRDEYKACGGGSVQNGWDHTGAQILLSYLSFILQTEHKILVVVSVLKLQSNTMNDPCLLCLFSLILLNLQVSIPTLNLRFDASGKVIFLKTLFKFGT